MPPPARAHLPAGLMARVRCRKAAVPELAGRLAMACWWLAKGQRQSCCSQSCRPWFWESLPIHGCHFGLGSPPRLYSISCARSSAQLPKGRLVMFFLWLENPVLGLARSPRSRSSAWWVRRSLWVVPTPKTHCWQRQVFRAGLTAVAGLSWAARVRRGRRSRLL